MDRTTAQGLECPFSPSTSRLLPPLPPPLQSSASDDFRAQPLIGPAEEPVGQDITAERQTPPPTSVVNEGIEHHDPGA